MALVVENGDGLATADSYLGVEELRSVVRDRGLWFVNDQDPTEYWFDSKEHDELEAALRRATSYLDGEYGDRYVGSRLTVGQSLAWPRTTRGTSEYRPGLMYVAGLLRSNLFPYDGYSLPTSGPSAGVPPLVRQAVAQIAVRELARPGGMRPDNSEGAVVSESVGGAISVAYEGARVSVDRIPQVDALLKPLLRDSNVATLRRA